MKGVVRTFWAAYKHEVRQLFTQPNTYIFLTFSWVSIALATFYLGEFFAQGRAEMHVFFAFQPWVYLLLLPALAMGSWGEEWRRGTAERLLTLPVSPAVLTFAKFRALLTVFVIMLVGTLPMVATVAWLGTPDWGPILAGYAGCLFAGGAMLAISMAMSQLSRLPAGGFVLGVLALFIWLASGWGLLTRLLEGFLPQTLVDLLIRFSLLDRFRNFNEGLFDLRDIVFFVSVAFVFLVLTHTLLRLRQGYKRRWWVTGLVLLVFVGINGLLLPVQLRWDVTAGGLHSLHPASSTLIRELEEDVEVILYFSADNSEVPVPVQQFYQRVYGRLKDIQTLNPERIKLMRQVPERSVDIEAQGVHDGLQELPLPSGEGYYFGLVMKGGGRISTIPVLMPVRQNFLEFDLMNALAGLQRTRQPKIGVLTELNLGDEQLRPRFMKDILAAYEVEILQPGAPVFSPDLDLVILFMTPFFDRESLYALDQYLVRGGNVLLVLDPLLRTAQLDDFKIPDRHADAFAFDHPADLLRKLGVEYDYNQIVGDLALAQNVRLEGAGLTRYPFWLALGPRDINDDLPFTAFVQNLLLVESGFFTPVAPASGLTYEAVLTTTGTAQTVARSLFDQKAPQILAQELGGEQQIRDLAVLITGRFPSTYADVPAYVRQYYQDYAVDPAQVQVPAHQKKAAQAGALLVLGDLDFLADDYALRRDVVYGEPVLQPANDNLVFFFNAVQYLAGDDRLMPLRGKAVEIRPFTRVEDMLRDVTAQYQKLEQELAAELFQVAERLKELRARSQRYQAMEEDIQAEISAFQQRELDVKKRLREVRRDLRKDIGRLERTLLLLNMLLAPAFAWTWALWLFHRRRKRARL
jgi:ABC-2 type transport system permease protein